MVRTRSVAQARRSGALPPVWRFGASVAVALLAANCGSPPQTASRSVDPRYGVAASPRVVEEDVRAPKGGGRDHVGKPYQIAGRTYVPRPDPHYRREGLASWYGKGFHGRLTANGEVFDRFSVSAAHTTMPLPSYARVTNVQNGRSMIVRVNDRGPYHANRLIDVSQRVAEALDFRRAGMARVRVEYVGRASVRGSDDERLMASLRTDGQPAAFPGMTAPVMVASADPTATAGAFTARPAAARSVAAAPTASTATPPAPAPAGRMVANAPVPPQRPFDLGLATRNARDEARPARARVASLFYAEPEMASDGFAPGSPFAALAPQRFVPLKTEH